MGGRAIWFVLFVALAFAGCADGGTKQEADPSPSSVIVAGDSASGGGITGRVVDDQVQPIAGAEVALLETEYVATTDEGGDFAFQNLEPGRYKIAAQRLGYTAVARSVEVADEAVSDVILTLVALPVEEEGWADVRGPEKGFANCLYGTALVSGGCAVSQVMTNEKSSFRFTMHNATTSLVAEMRWSQSTAATSTSNGLSFSYVGRSVYHYWCWGAGKSPIKWQYNWEDNECIATGASPKQQSAPDEPTPKQTLTLSIAIPFRPIVPSTSDPLPVHMTLQQSFEVMYTLFQNMAPADNYSAFPDA